MNEPLLSVCLITYNHVKYIREAIESVLMQKVNFSWELIIADDFSTDGTREILLDYKDKYPDFIKLILQEENVGAAKNWIDLITYPTSKYIAYFEGDDYWISPFKLQLQVDFLEANSDFSICTSNVILKNLVDNSESEWFGVKQNDVSSLKDILRFGSGGASCTLLFRSQAIEVIPDWFYLCNGDWGLQILCATHGKMKYFNDVFGVYRRNEGGITAPKSIDKNIQLHESYGINTINILIENFSSYEKELKTHAAEYWYYTLAYLYNKKGDKKKTRLTIIKIFKQIKTIKISYRKMLYLVLLYIKNISINRKLSP